MIGLDFKIAVNPAEADFNGPPVRSEAACLKIKKCDSEKGDVWHDVTHSSNSMVKGARSLIKFICPG
jgi:hypothetical protein